MSMLTACGGGSEETSTDTAAEEVVEEEDTAEDSAADGMCSDETFSALQDNYASMVEAYNAVKDLYESDEIEAEGILPFYMGYKDTWTCLSPWNSAVASLTSSTVCKDVNKGETTFSDQYVQVAEEMKTLLQYGEANPVAYSYNDACTAFAKGESAMYMIGSYAVPQIQSVNPDINIDSFVFPASNNKDDMVLTSGVDLQFCVMEDCPNKEAAYEVLRFLLEDENVQDYIDNQNAVPCKKGDFKLASMLDGMQEYLDNGIVTDYQDHFYPSEMAVDALIQTYLLDGDTEAFLKKFDTEWKRYNRDLITKVRKYEQEHSGEEE